MIQPDMDIAKERYFLEAEKNMHLYETIAEIQGENVWQTVINKLQSILSDWDVDVANEGVKKRYFSGILRYIMDSSPIYCDWSPYDSRTEDWIINRVTK